MAIKRFCTILGISGCLVTPLGVYAQLIKIKTSTTKQTECDWYNCSFEKDSVYGACVNDAYEYAKNKKKKEQADELSGLDDDLADMMDDDGQDHWNE